MNINVKDILFPYLRNLITDTEALKKLEDISSSETNRGTVRDKGLARCASSFILRVQQYNSGIASANDMCLSIRDMVLIFGQAPLPDLLYDLVRRNGKEFGLNCERGNQVSCQRNFPNWLTPYKYIYDVYDLKPDPSSIEQSSAGDALLRKYTRFSNYKSFEQKLAVQTAINLPKDYSLLISQPTGGGKSLTTQMLISSSNGLTVIVVPTIALALDQKDAAKHNLRDSSSIYCYLGGQDNSEHQEILNAIKSQTAKALFISPEAILKNKGLNQLLDVAAETKYLKNIVIDEAHIVPDWGVFFRPDFQLLSIEIAKWRKLSNHDLRIYMLSATLSDDVVATLFDLFGFEGKNVQLRCDTLRQEPRYYYCSVKSRDEQKSKLIEAIYKLPKPMVVYVLEPEDALNLQRDLKNRGFSNIPVFTGKSKDNEREKILKGWKKNEFDVVIATSAFGIGVDKPNVRTIIHACCPENLSRFYQEVGRGGRDHLPSLSILLPYQNRNDGGSDVHRAFGLVRSKILTVDTSVIRWNSMLSSKSSECYHDYCILDTSTAPSTMSEDEAELTGKRNVSWNINLLLSFKRMGFIDLEDVSFISENNTYFVKVRYLKPEILGDQEKLKSVLEIPRNEEYNKQKAGYDAMVELINNPKKQCWGHAFKQLFPLSSAVCSGCPADSGEKSSVDSKFKLRNKPEIELPPATPSRPLKRRISSFNELVIERKSIGKYTSEEINILCEKSSKLGLGTAVIPNNYDDEVNFNGIVLDYDEFIFAVDHTPYLFAKGILCLMGDNKSENISLYKAISKLKSRSYVFVIYGNPNNVITGDGRAIRDEIEGYTITIDRL